MNTKIKNIIFDLGGVILDIDETVVYKELEKLGINTTELAHSKEFIELMSKFDTGVYTAPTFRKKAKALLGLDKMTDKRFDDIWNAMLLDIPRERIEAIEKVKKHYKIFLMSNTNVIHYDLYIRDLQLRFGYNEFDELFHKSYFSSQNISKSLTRVSSNSSLTTSNFFPKRHSSSTIQRRILKPHSLWASTPIIYVAMSWCATYLRMGY